MSLQVKRVYGAGRAARPQPPSLPPSSPACKRRRLANDDDDDGALPLKKRAITKLGNATNTRRPKPKTKSKPPPKEQLTQLHFSIDTTILKSCALCGLSYTKGAPGDESLHRAHCARVQRGMEWGKEEERDCVKAGVEVIETSVRLRDGKRGRIICFRADVGGKIGTKTATLLDTINLTLSAPALTPAVLRASKVYLFLLSGTTPSPSGREKIVGCVIAQRISTAMAIAPLPPSSTDSDISLTLDPTPLPTPLGIPRLFTPTAHRRLGIATRLLSAAARTAVHGCTLDPTRGEIAFTQPTDAGRGVMEHWCGGAVRVYEE